MILTFQDLVEAIDTGYPFAHARYGDGEWAAIFGEKGKNCDGHEYFDRLGQDLAFTLIDDHEWSYHYGMVRIAVTVFGNRIQNYLSEHNINITWTDGTTMADASKQGKLYPLINVLRQRKILYVGPAHLNTAEFREKLFSPASYIEVPAVNCYLEMDALVCAIDDKIYHSDYDLIGFSAGPATEVMMGQLWRLLEARTAMIDFGSLWDGLVSKPSRKYQKSPSWKELIDSNLRYEY